MKNKTAKPPAINCAHSAVLKVADLAAKVHPRNPNTHPAAQVELLAKIIEHTGWRRPIRLSKRSGLITAGHCSLLDMAGLRFEKLKMPDSFGRKLIPLFERIVFGLGLQKCSISNAMEAINPQESTSSLTRYIGLQLQPKPKTP